LDWTIEFERDAIRQLNRLDKSVRRRVVQFLDSRVVASHDPRHPGKALHGELAGFWRYRVGDYRLICLLEDERRVVTLIRVEHRREVYR
jgi:mRNA interferase RelE/StbE